MENVTTANSATIQEGICPSCGNPLEVSRSNRNRGQFKRCVPCYGKQRLKEWYEKNRERAIEKGKAYYRQTRTRRLEVAQLRRNSMSPAERNKNNRQIALKRKYGLTLEQYEQMVADQRGLCFLCGEKPPAGRPLSVDHCHKTQTVRKLLCDVCNRSLGHIERDPSWVTRALQYLNLNHAMASHNLSSDSPSRIIRLHRRISMHVTTKDVVQDDKQAKALNLPVGTHILTCIIEGDGAVELASENAELNASVISKQRTASGGIQVQVAVEVKEPVPVLAPTPEQQALAYFTSKGFTEADAKTQLARFGVDRVLAQKANEEAAKQASLDKELAAVLASEKPTPAVN